MGVRTFLVWRIYGREMPEVVGAADEQATDRMQANKGRERVLVCLITTLLLLGRFNDDYGQRTDIVPRESQQRN